MRALIFSIIILGLSACSSYTCEDFRTGSFSYSDPQFEDYSITRDSLTQTERYMVDGQEVEDVYHITWDGACSYTLVMKESSDPRHQFHTKYDTIHARIREITPNGYMFHTLLHGKEVQGEMILTSD